MTNAQRSQIIKTLRLFGKLSAFGAAGAVVFLAAAVYIEGASNKGIPIEGLLWFGGSFVAPPICFTLAMRWLADFLAAGETT